MFIFGLKVALIGMGIVFCALVFLIFVINVISAGAKSLDAKVAVAAEKKPEAAVTNIPTNATAANQDEIVAVITAAINAYSQNAAVVKTITRVVGSAAPAWSHTGRVETMSLRQIS